MQQPLLKIVKMAEYPADFKILGETAEKIKRVGAIRRVEVIQILSITGLRIGIFRVHRMLK